MLSDTMVTLQFADNFVKHHYEIIEDVLVMVYKFIFSLYCVFLEILEDYTSH